MSDTDEEIEIAGPDDLEIDTLEQTDAGAEHQEVDEVAQLKADLEEERRARLAEKARADAYETRTADSHSKLRNEIEGRLGAEERAAESFLAAAASKLSTAKSQFVKAQEEGRFADAAELAEEIADARSQVNAGNYRKSQLSDMRARAEAEASTQQRDDTPEQSLLSRLSAASQDWFRRHPTELSKAANDPAYFDRIARADGAAYGSGIERDTPEYFDYVEQKLGLKEAGAAAATPERRPARTAGNTAAAAPAARRSSGATSAGRTVHLNDIVRQLTPGMREAAISSNPKLDEQEAFEIYARGIVKQKQREPGFAPEIKI